MVPFSPREVHAAVNVTEASRLLRQRPSARQQPPRVEACASHVTSFVDVSPTWWKLYPCMQSSFPMVLRNLQTCVGLLMSSCHLI